MFFVNPDLPFSATTVLRGLLLYGGTLGLATALLHLPFAAGGSGRAERALPWTLSLALAFSAWLDGMHASRFAYFLPPGINDRLVKTALWLSLGALIAFYTALLHTLHRRPYGRRSRLGLLLVAILSVLVGVERRAAYLARPSPAPRPAVVEKGVRPRLWVVGIDTATLDAILPLAGAGRLPFFAALLRDGSYARLGTLNPTRRDALWTTVATGKLPFQHGVTGWRSYPAPLLCPDCVLRLLPFGVRFADWGVFGARGQPEPEHARNALALWEILGRLGVATGVVGWPKAGQGGNGESFVLSERWFRSGGEGVRAWPPESGRLASAVRFGARDLTLADLAAFPPAARRALAPALAADRWRLEVALRLRREQAPVDAELVLLPGLREASRRSFGGFSATHFDGSKGRLAREAAEELGAYYVALDQLLARLWASEEGPRILAVVSAHGVRTAQGWERILGGVSAARAVEGRFQGAPDGALLLYGAGIRKGELLTGARLVDAAPTLLYSLGMPLAGDLDGRVLTGAFEKDFLARNPVVFLPSFEGLRQSDARP